MPYTVTFNAAAVILTQPEMTFPGREGAPDEVVPERKVVLSPDQLGSFEELEPGRHLLYLDRVGDHDLIGGLTLDEARRNLPGFVEVEAMSCMIPHDVMFPDGKYDRTRAGVKKYLHETFTTVATGGKTENGYKVRALVNPQAIGQVDDNGAYRSIHLKPEFNGGLYEIRTTISVAQVNALRPK